MKSSIFTFLCFLISLTAFSNDGIYLTSGSTIYPVNETNISLDKEVLSFSMDKGMASVNIYFEFNNPDPVTRVLKVGFQAPSSEGDVTGSYANKSQIREFKIQYNNQLIPYSLKAAECVSCPLKDTSELDFSQSQSGIFVYLFEIEFKPGINKIHHSYLYPGGNNVSINQIYDYILTTGAKWAGGQIGDLRVHIDFGKNSYFFVKDIFGPGAEWKINGTGKITDSGFEYEYFNRMVRVLSGHLEISVQNFSPETEFEFGVISNYGFISYLLDEETVPIKIIISIKYRKTDLKYMGEGPMTKEELRICRNAVFAEYGYNFRDKKLSEYFSQFDWYIPDPNLAMEDIELTPKDQAYINEIVEMERVVN